ncbi:RNA-binding protein 33-like [Schistocerca piceifrons]|uniref:RNA-binding protein 33-like n=1 Tax=Schistocerca piceifrons TaxID=274613 RepID=UPI001F5EA6AE|nr:RNA-binding protein 33-like [Schistocerca piceifrons]
MPAYWKEVFAIITAAIPHRLAGRVSSPDGSADDQPREQQPPTGLSSAGLSPSSFHHRPRRSLDDRPRAPVCKCKDSEYSVQSQVLVNVQGSNNYQVPPPSQVTVDNSPVEVTQLPPNWPFHPGAPPPRRYVWTENIWEEVIYENGKWDVITPRRPLNPPSHTQESPQPLYILVDDVWILITTVDILWDDEVNSFHPPQKLLHYQPNSSPTYVWIENKWVQIVNINNQWIATAPAQGNNIPPGSQNKKQIVLVWDTKNWVLFKLSDLFPATNGPPEYQSHHPQKPGDPHSGNKHPTQRLNNQQHISPYKKEEEKTGKHPEKLTNANSGSSIPPPLGLYNVQPVSKPLRPLKQPPPPSTPPPSPKPKGKPRPPKPPPAKPKPQPQSQKPKRKPKPPKPPPTKPKPPPPKPPPKKKKMCFFKKLLGLGLGLG